MSETLVRAATLARVSSAEQAKKYGLSVQEEDLEERADEKGWPIVRRFVSGGVSGMLAQGDRDDIAEIIAAAKRKEFEVLIVPDVDRLARDAEIFLRLDREIPKLGVRIDYLGFENDGSDGSMMEKIQRAADAHKEWIRIRRRTMKGRLRKVRRDKLRPAGRPSYGYLAGRTPDGKPGATLEHPVEALEVPTMFRRILERWTLNDLRRDLDRRGVRSRSGKPWSISTLRVILTNEVYIGRGYYNRRIRPKNSKTELGVRPRAEWLEFPTPRLVGDDVFSRVQKILVANKTLRAGRPGDPRAYLKGLVRCGTHARNLNARRRQENGVEWRYYECPTRGCGLRESADVLEADAWAVVTEIMTDEQKLLGAVHRWELARAVDEVEARSAVDHARGKLKVERAELERLLDRLTDSEALASERARLRTRAEAAEARVEEWETALREAEARVTPGAAPTLEALRAHAREVVRTLRSPETADPVWRAQLLRVLVARIVVHAAPRQKWARVKAGARGTLEYQGPLFGKGLRSLSENFQNSVRLLTDTEDTESFAPSLRGLVGRGEKLAPAGRHPA